MPANTLRLDPTRTSGLRRRFLADLQRRFAAVAAVVYRKVVLEDAFGLVVKSTRLVVNDRQEWRFLTDEAKVEAFNAWLKTQVDGKILGATGGTPGQPWSSEYITSAYSQGVQRAYGDVRPEAMAENLDFYKGSRGEFLRGAFGAPETVAKLRLLATRNFNGLKGYTDAALGQIGTRLAAGVANGQGPRSIANEIQGRLGVARSKAFTLARTETINAHAEGQLDSFEKLGVGKLRVMAEWDTAGDGRVCKVCGAMEGVVLTPQEARGLIPRHPNCRCAWLPAGVGEDTKGAKWSKEQKADSIAKSIQGETGQRGRQAQRASRWAGRGLQPSVTKKPPTLVGEGASAGSAAATARDLLRKEKAAAELRAKDQAAQVAAELARQATEKAAAAAAEATAARERAAALGTPPPPAAVRPVRYRGRTKKP